MTTTDRTSATTAEFEARVAEIEAASVAPEAWDPGVPHSDACTPNLRSEGMYAADCGRCEHGFRWINGFVRGEWS